MDIHMPNASWIDLAYGILISIRAYLICKSFCYVCTSIARVFLSHLVGDYATEVQYLIEAQWLHQE